jgi:hypothetical protein
MGIDPREAAAASALSDHVDDGGTTAEESPRPTGGVVPEDCPVATGQHGCHPVAVGSEERVSHRVDTAMDSVQAPGGASLRNSLVGQPQRQQLAERDNSVLPCRQLGDHAVKEGWLQLRNHRFRKCSHPRMVAARE